MGTFVLGNTTIIGGLPARFVSLNEAGSVVLDIDGLRLDLTFLNEKGEKRDWFTLSKESASGATHHSKGAPVPCDVTIK